MGADTFVAALASYADENASRPARSCVEARSRLLVGMQRHPFFVFWAITILEELCQIRRSENITDAFLCPLDFLFDPRSRFQPQVRVSSTLLRYPVLLCTRGARRY